jgi:Uma2 family endonuclease
MFTAAPAAPRQTKPLLTLTPTFYRFTVAQYQQMVAQGVLGPDDHVELLEGWIAQKMARNPPHDNSLNVTNRLLVRMLPDEWFLRNQSAIILAHSVPEPDFSIVRGPASLYADRHPRPADIALLIEIADSTLLQDRQQKGLLYAQARIPEFWLINLVETRVEVYTQPKGGKAPAYKQRQDYKSGAEVPLVLGGKEIGRLAVSALCPVKA